jgi:hypothetical protein
MRGQSLSYNRCDIRRILPALAHRLAHACVCTAYSVLCRSNASLMSLLLLLLLLLLLQYSSLSLRVQHQQNEHWYTMLHNVSKQPDRHQ